MTSSKLVIRAAHVNIDFVEADVRECRRREDELRQQSTTARAAAVSDPHPEGRGPSKNGAPETRADVSPNQSAERCRGTSEAATMRRWAYTSLRLCRELLDEHRREVELLRQGRIDTTSDQRRITQTWRTHRWWNWTRFCPVSVDPALSCIWVQDTARAEQSYHTF